MSAGEARVGKLGPHSMLVRVGRSCQFLRVFPVLPADSGCPGETEVRTVQEARPEGRGLRSHLCETSRPGGRRETGGGPALPAWVGRGEVILLKAGFLWGMRACVLEPDAVMVV